MPLSVRSYSIAGVVLAFGIALALACGSSDNDNGGGAGGGADASSAEGSTLSGTGGDASNPSSKDSGGSQQQGDAAPSMGCGTANVKPGYLGQQSTMLNGSPRSYALFIGSKYDGKTALPVVFSFHGDGGNGAGMRKTFDLETPAAGGAIFVYPDGPNQTWDLETPPAMNLDYQFFDVMVKELETKYCVDKSKIFTFGFSRGGFFVNQLGCFRGDTVRAITAHSGGGPYSNNPADFDQNGFFHCTTPPVPALIIHGQADSVVPIAGGGQKSRDHWVTADTCQTSSAAYNPSPCVSYNACKADHPVVWCAIPGLDHAPWSSANTASWSFFTSL